MIFFLGRWVINSYSLIALSLKMLSPGWLTLAASCHLSVFSGCIWRDIIIVWVGVSEWSEREEDLQSTQGARRSQLRCRVNYRGNKMIRCRKSHWKELRQSLSKKNQGLLNKLMVRCHPNLHLKTWRNRFQRGDQPSWKKTQHLRSSRKTFISLHRDNLTINN